MLFIQTSASETINSSLENYYHSFLEVLPRIALGILVIIAGVLIAKFVTNFYKKRILKKAEDPLMAKFLAQAIKIILTLIAILLALQVAGLSGVATGILTAAGGAAIVLGFAFQDIGKNFLAGIILAFNRPFNINDTIMVADLFGKVKALNFRYTHIKTSDGRDIFIPNSDVLTKAVENYTADGFYRNDFIVGIGYEDNIEEAKKAINDILDHHPEIVHDDIHDNFVIENELAASTVNLKVFFWVETLDYRKSSRILRGNVIKQVKEVLVEKGFNLPADITELKLYGNEEDIPLRVRKDPRDLIEQSPKSLPQ
ncbi:mechanosensitive ion channel-like protein [Winogradskyella epiphytica]|uniref:Mechanosensitive ion channel-like protein n=1 Tax=Winogradskyella epiphytica TaxID=262005 RepID=A0A2V4X7K7_9FLAO|nr:mechanosensitive ion channel family protein [Winogradskyella epiphytica]PYE81619.1 mechanosensitive ion channel-like protein [Winogradskyella epiphytica]GGW63861.1 transporter [Winogradskyella epiphytica]